MRDALLQVYYVYFRTKPFRFVFVPPCDQKFFLCICKNVSTRIRNIYVKSGIRTTAIRTTANRTTAT